MLLGLFPLELHAQTNSEKLANKPFAFLPVPKVEFPAVDSAKLFSLKTTVNTVTMTGCADKIMMAVETLNDYFLSEILDLLNRDKQR